MGPYYWIHSEHRTILSEISRAPTAVIPPRPIITIVLFNNSLWLYSSKNAKARNLIPSGYIICKIPKNPKEAADCTSPGSATAPPAAQKRRVTPAFPGRALLNASGSWHMWPAAMRWGSLLWVFDKSPVYYLFGIYFLKWGSLFWDLIRAVPFWGLF